MDCDFRALAQAWHIHMCRQGMAAVFLGALLQRWAEQIYIFVTNHIVFI